MYFPRLKINTEKISHNARIINDRCAEYGISVVGVTKSVLANKIITENLEKAGIETFADSRLPNVKRLLEYIGDPGRIIMLRTPMPGEIDDLINTCGTSLNTQVRTVELLTEACERYEKYHDIIIMVETGDEREGILPDDVPDFCRSIMGKSRYLNIKGIGTNARCITANGPTIESIDILVSLKNELEKKLGLEIEVLSGGNSSIWKMVDSGKLPQEINQVRIGEAIFLGHETAGYTKIKGTSQDCFILEAEIIEVKTRNNNPYRIILALGLQDVRLEDIELCDKRLKPGSQSSDHTMLDITDGHEDRNTEKDFSNLKVGSIISFNLNYYSLLSCMTSPFIEKVFI